MDEGAWAAAEAADSFVQAYPRPGAPAALPTEARVLYDGDALYVGIRAREAPGSVAAPLTRRDDAASLSDWIHVLVDGYGDRRVALQFSVNPRGVQRDSRIYDDGREEPGWDAVWEAAAHIDAEEWTAEFRIPASQLRFRPGSAAWGFQVMRDAAVRGERDVWSPWTPSDPGLIARFGTLEGVRMRPALRLEVQPYASTRVVSVPYVTDGPFSGTRAAPAVGGDLRLGLTSALSLSATVNPDFGQVEVDPAVLNLTAFETFFPEKRPFFAEGGDVFRFGHAGAFVSYGQEQPFYSRRIGGPPHLDPRWAGARWADMPDRTTILGAARLSGRAGPWTLGALSALTGREEARFVGPDQARGRTAVEPTTGWLTGRVQRDPGGGAPVVGALGTAVIREQDEPFSALRSRAYMGGVDIQHFWAGRAWMAGAWAAGSRIEGSRVAIATAQDAPARYFGRPDAAHLARDTSRTALDGYAAEAAVRHAGEWGFSLSAKQVSPGFEINDLGFQGRSDYRSLALFLSRRSDAAGRLLRGGNMYAAAVQAWNFGGQNVDGSFSLGGSGTFRNFWSASFEASYFPAHLDDRLTRGGPLTRTPAGWSLYGSFGTDPRRPARLGSDLYLRTDASGAHERRVGMAAELRPSPAVRLTAGPAVSRAWLTGQYVSAIPDAVADATFGTRYVFAELRQTNVSLETRLDWTFTPALSLQLYAQPFLASVDYLNYGELQAPRTYAFSVYGRDEGSIRTNPETRMYTVDPDGPGPAAPFEFDDPDFTLRSLRGNAVLRWEWRPGSTLFLVWQQVRSGYASDAGLNWEHDTGALFRAPATNVFVAKMTYWLAR
ncbi:MAG TPA: DUF5916 domain-containing protein [Longimicrobium sp.]